MNLDNYVVKINVKSKVIDFNYPLNIYETQNKSGTGFFINKTQILTCYHVISGAITIDIIFRQTNSIHGTIKHIFPDDDLAIIEIPNENPNVEILEHKIINTRQSGDVFTIGFPLSSTNIKITKGIISGYQESLIQTDATLNHGNSGGPLVILDETDNKYKVIGINVSKLKGDAEKTGYVVPIYRFHILKSLLKNNSNIIIKKPCLLFEFQILVQEKLRINLFKNKIGEITDKTGVRVSVTNSKYYHSKYIKENNIILAVNGNPVDYNGYIKFDFYPEKISLDDIGLWFMQDDKLTFTIFDTATLDISSISFNLKIIETNLFSFYNSSFCPNYFVENNGLILSIVTEQHLEKLQSLKLNINKIIKILERRLYHKDLFTVYLSDTEYSKINNYVSYPIGEIITEINDKKFDSYDEFINIVKEPITKIKTNENDIFFL